MVPITPCTPLWGYRAKHTGEFSAFVEASLFRVNVKRWLLKSVEIWITLRYEEMASFENGISGGDNGKL